MRVHHVTVFVFIVTLHIVTCQVDMFELHDKERGDVSMHVTRDNAVIEAVSDSVSLVMNPLSSSSTQSLSNSTLKRDNTTVAGNKTSIVRDNERRSGGYTIGNLDQTDITVKQDSNNILNGGARSTVSDTSHVDIHGTDLLPGLPVGNRVIHVEQDGYSIKRNSLPTSLFDKSPTPSFGKLLGTGLYLKRKFKRHYRPRPPCSLSGSIKTLPKNRNVDSSDVLGDFNEIMEKSKNNDKDANRSNMLGDFNEIMEKSAGNSKRMLPSGDTRHEGELYNIHDGNKNRRESQIRSCVRASKRRRHLRTFVRTQNVKDVNATKKTFPLDRNYSKAFLRLRTDEGTTKLTHLNHRYDSQLAKRSGVNEMKIHNELGGMHIKSNPSETAVVSESGNIEITMLNDAGSSSKKRAGTKVGLPGLSTNGYDTARSRQIISEHESQIKDSLANSPPKAHLHLAEDISLKKSQVNTNSHKVVNS